MLKLKRHRKHTAHISGKQVRPLVEHQNGHGPKGQVHSERTFQMQLHRVERERKSKREQNIQRNCRSHLQGYGRSKRHAKCVQHGQQTQQQHIVRATHKHIKYDQTKRTIQTLLGAGVRRKERVQWQAAQKDQQQKRQQQRELQRALNAQFAQEKTKKLHHFLDQT